MLTGSALTPAIIATTALESTPPERNAPSGTSAIIRKLDRFPQAIDELGFRVALADRIVEREPDIPVFARLRHRLAAPDRQRMRRGELEGACVDGARLGNVAQREIFLDREADRDRA